MHGTTAWRWSTVGILINFHTHESIVFWKIILCPLLYIHNKDISVSMYSKWDCTIVTLLLCRLPSICRTLFPRNSTHKNAYVSSHEPNYTRYLRMPENNYIHKLIDSMVSDVQLFELDLVGFWYNIVPLQCNSFRNVYSNNINTYGTHNNLYTEIFTCNNKPDKIIT